MYDVMGGNIASIVFYDQLQAKKRGSFFGFGSLGSGWAGLERGNLLLDLGQRYFELGFENSKQRPLSEYSEKENPRDFTEVVRSFIISKGFELTEARVEAFFRGKIIRCPLETTDLRGVISCLSNNEKNRIRSEILKQPKSRKHDMSNYGYSSYIKKIPNLFDMLRYNHGDTFNNLVIYPFTDKFQIPLKEVPTRLRRKVWAPIFFSQTILSHLNNDPDFFPSRPHFKIKSHSTSKLIQTTVEDIKQSNFTATESFRLTSDNLDMINGETSPLTQIKFGSSLNPILSDLGVKLNIEKLVIRLLWFRVKQSDSLRDIDYLSVIDRHIPVTRISTSSWCHNSIYRIYCVETFDMEISVEKVFSLLCEMELIKEGSNVVTIADLSAPAMDKPTFGNEKSYQEMVQVVRRKIPNLDIDLVTRQFGKNTFNEQVLLGLKKAHEVNNE